MTLISSYGGPDSNSYVSVTEANSFIKTAIIDNTSWTSATNATKQAALMEASRDVDSRKYVGTRFFSEQHLEFPRQLKSRFPFDRTVNTTITQDLNQRRMQRNVKEATCFQALHLLRLGGRNRDLENQQNGIVQISESVGPMREFIQYGQRVNPARAKLSSDAAVLLAPWMTKPNVLRA